MTKILIGEIEVQIEDRQDEDGLCTYFGFYLNGKNYRSKMKKNNFDKNQALNSIRRTLLNLGIKDLVAKT